MLSVSMHTDISTYKPKLVGKLTFRSLICSVLAIGISIAIGIYSWFVLRLPTDITQFLVFLFALPIWAVGFWRPKGMQAEEFVPLWLEHTFSSGKIYLKSSPYMRDVLSEHKVTVDKKYLKRSKKRGFEQSESIELD